MRRDSVVSNILDNDGVVEPGTWDRRIHFDTFLKRRHLSIVGVERAKAELPDVASCRTRKKLFWIGVAFVDVDQHGSSPAFMWHN
jgi:hypothetical protein